MDEEPTQQCYTGEEGAQEEVDQAELDGEADDDATAPIVDLTQTQSSTDYAGLADAAPFPQPPPPAPKKKPGRPKGANVLSAYEPPYHVCWASVPPHGMRSKMFYVRAGNQASGQDHRQEERSR